MALFIVCLIVAAFLMGRLWFPYAILSLRKRRCSRRKTAIPNKTRSDQSSTPCDRRTAPKPPWITETA